MDDGRRQSAAQRLVALPITRGSTRPARALRLLRGDPDPSTEDAGAVRVIA